MKPGSLRRTDMGNGMATEMQDDRGRAAAADKCVSVSLSRCECECECVYLVWRRVEERGRQH